MPSKIYIYLRVKIHRVRSMDFKMQFTVVGRLKGGGEGSHLIHCGPYNPKFVPKFMQNIYCSIPHKQKRNPILKILIFNN